MCTPELQLGFSRSNKISLVATRSGGGGSHFYNLSQKVLEGRAALGPYVPIAIKSLPGPDLEL